MDMRGSRGRFWASSTGRGGSVRCLGRFVICRARRRGGSSIRRGISGRWVSCGMNGDEGGIRAGGVVAAVYGDIQPRLPDPVKRIEKPYCLPNPDLMGLAVKLFTRNIRVPVHESSVRIVLPRPDMQRVERRQTEAIGKLEVMKELSHKFGRSPDSSYPKRRRGPKQSAPINRSPPVGVGS